MEQFIAALKDMTDEELREMRQEIKSDLREEYAPWIRKLYRDEMQAIDEELRSR